MAGNQSSVSSPEAALHGHRFPGRAGAVLGGPRPCDKLVTPLQPSAVSRAPQLMLFVPALASLTDRVQGANGLPPPIHVRGLQGQLATACKPVPCNLTDGY